MLPGMGMIGKGNAIVLSVVISASQNNVNLFTLAGSPTSSGTYTFTINSGVIIGSTSTATAALVSGTFPTGSVVNLINNGAVYGKEGAGGTAASFINTNATAGGPAMSISNNITITNGSGSIFGGGGGGGYGMADSSGRGSYGGAGQGSGNSGGPTAGEHYQNGDDGLYYDGGTGGAWGTAGSDGVSGGVGGAAGKAIALNSKTVTWISGNDSTHVKGSVS